MHKSETGGEPLVSVALVVRNGEQSVALAIRSILAQSYENWELLIADDGSKDQTVARIQGIKDRRIRFLPHPDTRGLAFRLNELIDASRGKYFARMDADDFAFADRFGKQVGFLEKHAEVDLLGCGAISFEAQGRIVGKSRVSATHEEICRHPWRGFPLYHPTWMGRRDWFRENKYEARLHRAQDFELLLRTFRRSRFYCLEEPLLGYRVEQLTLARQFRSRKNVVRILIRHAVRHDGVRLLWGAAEQGLKLGLDSVAILTGLKFKLLRHRALPVSECEREVFQRTWAALQTN